MIPTNEITYNEKNISFQERHIRGFCKIACSLWMELNCKKKRNKNYDGNNNNSNGMSQNGQSRKPINTRKHTCGNRCMNQNVRFCVFLLPDGDYHTCLIDAINSVTLCALGGNPEDHTHQLLNIDHLWLCKRSGSFHLCGLYCDQIFKPTDDGTLPTDHVAGIMCQISGLWITTQQSGIHELHGTSNSGVDKSRMFKWMTQAIESWKNNVYHKWAPVDPVLHTCRITGIHSNIYTENSPKDQHTNNAPSANSTTPNGSYVSSIDFTEAARILKDLPDTAQQSIKNTSKIIKESQDYACKIINIPATAYSINGGNAYHVCLGDYCSSRHSDYSLHQKVEVVLKDIYVCLDTSIPHFCGSWCTESAYNSDGLSVCKLTGLCLNEVMIRDPWFANDKHLSAEKDILLSASANDGQRRKNNNSNKNAPSANKIDIDAVAYMSGDAILGAMGDESRGDKLNIQANTKKGEFLLLAIARIMKLFSDDQLEKEMEKMHVKDQEVDSQITRYVSRIDQNKGLVILTDMYLLNINHQKKKEDVIGFDLSDDEKYNIARLYAQQCLCLWYIIRTKTKLGREKPNLFQFKDFIYPALSLFESGFEVPESDIGYRAIIIDEDPLFKARAPDIEKITTQTNSNSYSSSYQSKQGSPLKRRKFGHNDIGQQQHTNGNNNNHNSNKNSNEYNKNVTNARINIRSTKRKSLYDKVRKNIEIALYNAVTDEGISPEHLRISSVDYDQIDTTNDAFSNTIHRNNSNVAIRAKKQEQLQKITMSIPSPRMSLASLTTTHTLKYSTPAIIPVTPTNPYSLVTSNNKKQISYNSQMYISPSHNGNDTSIVPSHNKYSDLPVSLTVANEFVFNLQF